MTLLNMMLMVKVWYFSSLLDGHILPSRYTYAAPYEGVVQCVAIKSESRVKRKKKRRRDRNGVCQVYHSHRVPSLLFLITNQLFYFSRSFKFHDRSRIIISPRPGSKPIPSQSVRTPARPSLTDWRRGMYDQVQVKFKTNWWLVQNWSWTWMIAVMTEVVWSRIAPRSNQV